ncbi:MAG: MFS transporter [Jatrophihabitans sp.]
MLSRYRAAFDAPGALNFSAAGFLARLPIAIYPIAIVLIISGRTHSYGYAGVISGSYVLGGALGNPVAGMLVDRYGQHRILPPFLLGHLVAAAWFALAILTHAPLWTLLLPAALMGVTLLNIGALIRARWSRLWQDDPAQRSTAYSVESTLDEVIFVLGPLVATVLATHAPALITLGLALVLVSSGTLWLTVQQATEPLVRVREPGERHDFALRYRGMLLITWVMVFMGAVFGSAEVVMVAYCGQHGQRGSAGWVVACFAGGSGVAGVLYGARHWQSPLLHRFVISSVAFGLLSSLFFLATSIRVLALFAGLVGLGTAPTLIAAFGLIDSIAPAKSLTEGLTWIGTGLSVGYGLGAALVGGIADRHGAHAAFLVPLCCALVAAGFAVSLAVRMTARTGEPALRAG